MSTDLLNVAANERIDLGDFRHAVDVSFQENLRQINRDFFTPSGQRAWILDGFVMTNPAAKQLQVTKGRAILGQREGAIAYDGVLTTEGDSTKIVDMTPLAPNTYNVYIRFEYVDGDSASRIFWDATGTEVSQTLATRRTANWSLRVETSSPGAEWMQIGTADNTDVPVPGQLFIVDQRPLYFEGAVAGSYASGWSSDGGGIANDRNADRQQYGVTDFQTFTAAMRQCLEDIKGRGLRRWWERDIGGMNVGFDDDPTEDRLNVGDTDFGLDWVDANDVRLYGNDDDYLRFDRNEGSHGEWQFWVNNAEEFSVSDIGAVVQNGLVVGYDGTPENLKLKVGGDEFYMYRTASFNYLNFNTTGGNNWLQWYKSDNHGEFVHNGAQSFKFGTTGMNIWKGLHVGNGSTVPVNDYIVADGNIEAGLQLKCQGDAYVGSGLRVGGSTSNPGTGDIICAGGLRVGSEVLPTDNDIRVEADGYFGGGLHVGSPSSAAAVGDGIFTRGLVVGFDAAPADNDRIEIGDATFYLDWSASATTLRMDTAGGNSGIQFDKTNDELDFQILGIDEMQLRATGLSIENGLYVGSATGTATDNDIYAQGSIACGTTIDATGDGTFGTITMTGFSVDSDGDTIVKSIVSGTGAGKFTSDGSRVYIDTDSALPTGLTDEGYLIFRGDSVNALQINHAMPFGGGSTVLTVKGEGYDNEYCKITTYSFPTLEPFNNYHMLVSVWDWAAGALEEHTFFTAGGNVSYSQPTAGVLGCYSLSCNTGGADRFSANEFRATDLSDWPGSGYQNSYFCVEDRPMFNTTGGIYGRSPLVHNDERWGDRADRTINAAATEDQLAVHVIVPYSTIDYTAFEMTVFAHIENKTGSPDASAVAIYVEDQGGTGNKTVLASGTFSAPTDNEGHIFRMWGTCMPSDELRLHAQWDRYSTSGSRIGSEFDGAGTVFEHDQTSNTYIRIGATTGTTGTFDLVIDYIAFKFL